MAHATPASPTPRRHDLDAVRAFAMLLGLALHAALAYTDLPWSVRDPSGDAFYWHFFSFIHGFRMPLFFMLSGYFTAMLAQRRGLGGLYKHRSKRIALPLAIGLCTIIPLTWAVGIGASVLTAGETAATESRQADTAGGTAGEDPWTPSASGDLDRLRAVIDAGADLDAPDPTYGITPLGWAAMGNHPAAAAMILEAGAEPSGRYRDGNTPLHTACFFGRSEIANLLLDAGGNMDAINGTGETPLDSMGHGRGTTEFIAGLVQIEIEFDEVIAGREAISERIGRSPSSPAMRIVQGILFAFPIFYHLWFLWHLCWLVLGFIVVSWIGRALPRVPWSSALIATPLCLLWLIPVTAGLEFVMDARSPLPVMGPDTSAGLIPMPRVLLYNAVFFAFGALRFGTDGAERPLGKGWWLLLPLAVACYPVTMSAIYGTGWIAGAVPDAGDRAVIAAVGQAVFVWFMVFGMIGLAERVLARERKWVRYASDSSYWLYLAHLPMIIAMQAVLLFIDIPTWVKFTVIVAGSTLLLLVSYQLLVRYTLIGRTLNGPRIRPERGEKRTPDAGSEA